MYYICVHDPNDFLRQALRVGMGHLCPGVRVGKERLPDSACPNPSAEGRRNGGDVYPVEAVSLDALQCWIVDVNNECQRQCVHQVAVDRQALAK